MSLYRVADLYVFVSNFESRDVSDIALSDESWVCTNVGVVVMGSGESELSDTNDVFVGVGFVCHRYPLGVVGMAGPTSVTLNYPRVNRNCSCSMVDGNACLRSPSDVEHLACDVSCCGDDT